MLYCLFCCCVGRRQLVIALQRMFAQIYRELLEESCCQLDKQAEAASIACVALLLSSGPWGQFLPYSEVFMGCHSLGRLPFCHQFLKRQQHFSSFTVNNCEDFCGLTYPIVLDGKLLKFESFVKMGHDVARLYTAERRAMPCRAITNSKQSNDYWTW